MLNFATQTAREAGRLLAEKFGRALRVSNKGDIDLVTEADLAAGRLIVVRGQFGLSVQPQGVPLPARPAGR